MFRDALNDIRYINEPKALYAKLHQAANALLSYAQVTDRECWALPADKILANDYMTAYNRLWYYLQLHDNSMNVKITYNIIDMLLHIAPQYVKKVNEKYYLNRSKSEVKRFLETALITVIIVTRREGIKNGSARILNGVWEFNSELTILSIEYTSTSAEEALKQAEKERRMLSEMGYVYSDKNAQFKDILT